jgi:hypothetical protein
VGKLASKASGAVEEAKRTAGLVDSGARQATRLQQVQQVLLHLLVVQSVRAAPVVPRQPCDGLDVSVLRARGLAVQHQRIVHALPKWCHRRVLDPARAHARIDQATTIPTTNLR